MSFCLNELSDQKLGKLQLQLRTFGHIQKNNTKHK